VIVAGPFEVLPLYRSLELTRADGKLISRGALEVVVVTSKNPRSSLSVSRLILAESKLLIKVKLVNRKSKMNHKPIVSPSVKPREFVYVRKTDVSSNGTVM